MLNSTVAEPNFAKPQGSPSTRAPDTDLSFTKLCECLWQPAIKNIKQIMNICIQLHTILLYPPLLKGIIQACIKRPTGWNPESRTQTTPSLTGPAQLKSWEKKTHGTAMESYYCLSLLMSCSISSNSKYLMCR